VVDAHGNRLATRHGATAIGSLREAGCSAEQIVGELACSLGLTATNAPIRAEELVSGFELTKISRSPFTWNPKG